MATDSTATTTRSLETNWPISDYNDCVSDKFDFVIIGSSFCAYGSVEQLLRKKPDTKILIIEKGSYCPEIRDFSPVRLGEKEKETEEVSWEFPTDSDSLIKKVRGVNHFIGGRSSFWKAWCPRPKKEEMKEWPEKVVDKMQDLIPKAETLLGVKNVDEIGPPFHQLQDALFKQLKSLDRAEITRIDHAPLALVDEQSEYGKFRKFSVVKPLIDIVKKFDNVKLLADCEVTEIITSNESKASSLNTSKGSLLLGKARLILAMSTLPCTILAQNSSLNVPGIGKRFTGHFASYCFARVRCEGIYSKFAHDFRDSTLELAALYIAGLSASKHQFHIQLNAVAISGQGSPNLDRMKHLLKTPKDKMIETCHNHIVFVCASLGEVDHKNPKNKFYRRDGSYILEFEANDKDKELWKVMDDTTFKVLEHLSASHTIEYWNPNTEDWLESRPSSESIQHKALVHPASTMWIGEDCSSPVDLDYKVRGVDNVYMTGGALWPSAGSWNPTCAMTALSMDLADKLTSNS